MGGLFEDKDHAEATASTTTTDRKKMKKTTKGATIIKGAEGGRIGIAIHELGQNNVKNTPTKEEETEREKKLNQREALEVRKEKSTMKAIEGAFNVHRQRRRRRKKRGRTSTTILKQQ